MAGITIACGESVLEAIGGRCRQWMVIVVIVVVPIHVADCKNIILVKQKK